MKNNRIFINFFLIVTFFFILSCSGVEPPDIIEVTPGHQEIVGTDVTVRVVFSNSMNINKTEAAFSLFNDRGAVNGSYRWENRNKNMTFTPELPLQNGYYYTILISKGAGDEEGNSIVTEYISSFFVGRDLVPPVVDAILPEDGTPFFPLDHEIVITFSEPMDRMSVERGIRFTPALEGRFQWDDAGSSAAFYPNKRTNTAPLNFNTVYKITVTTDCKDMAGNNMLHPVQSFFRAGEEFDPPYLTGILDTSTGNDLLVNQNFYEHHGTEKNAMFVFNFSEPVNREIFREALSIRKTNVSYPAEAGRSLLWINDSTCHVLFLSDLVPLEHYTMIIEKSAKDMAGNSMSGSILFYFVVDGLRTVNPDISQITAVRFDSSEPLVEGQAVPLGVEYSDDEYEFHIVFTRAVDRSSVPENIQINCIYGEQPEISGKVKRYEWTDPSAEDRELTVALTSIKGGNLYELVLKGGPMGITGTNGVPLEKDYVYYFYFSVY